MHSRRLVPHYEFNRLYHPKPNTNLFTPGWTIPLGPEHRKRASLRKEQSRHRPRGWEGGVTSSRMHFYSVSVSVPDPSILTLTYRTKNTTQRKVCRADFFDSFHWSWSWSTSRLRRSFLPRNSDNLWANYLTASECPS